MCPERGSNKQNILSKDKSETEHLYRSTSPTLPKSIPKQSLNLLAHLRFEDGWGGCQGGLTTEPEDMVGALGSDQLASGYSSAQQCP